MHFHKMNIHLKFGEKRLSMRKVIVLCRTNFSIQIY